jgi:hypothetical protein
MCLNIYFHKLSSSPYVYEKESILAYFNLLFRYTNTELFNVIGCRYFMLPL